MGFFTKHEKYNPETERFEPVPRKPLFQRKVDAGELTREEQVEPKRLHPWQTERGKKVVGGLKKAGSRIDKAVVNYNRTRNPIRPGAPKISTGFGFNPWGSTFDRGMTPMKKPKVRSYDPFDNYGFFKKNKKHRRKR